MSFNSQHPTGGSPPGPDASPNDNSLVGESAAIGSIKDVAMNIASRRTTVLIQGETGTGKEMLARHIHTLSDRQLNPFVPVDCSSLTDTLFESQLFGHVKGAFTGAMRDSIGFVRAADTGTLFLDEIGELPLALQVKLLRVLQERMVTPVGDVRGYPVDIRVICATNRDLSAMVAEGTFREDLYFRINVVTMNVPPLRERVSDILPLAHYFLQQQAAVYGETPKLVGEDAQTLLVSYAWPGNVRELANAIEHAHVLAAGNEIIAENLPKRVQAATGIADAIFDLRLDDVERRTIAEALRRTKGNKAKAARMLGLNIQRLNRHIRKLKVHVPAF